MQPSDDKEPTEKNPAKKRILRMRERAKKMMDNPQEKKLRGKFKEYMRFIHVPGEQWDTYTKQARGQDRPMFEFNRARVTQKRIINGMRANRPQGKVRGYEDNDKDTAEVFEGLIRNIANLSDFDSITDNAAEYQVAAGYAAWRIVTKYSTSNPWEQDIEFEGIRNPLCLWCDEAAYEMTGKDARDWLFTDQLPNAVFKSRYPDAKKVSFESDMEDDAEWQDEETTRIAEYWWKEKAKKNLYLLSDGKIIEDADLQEAQGRGLAIVNQKEVDCYKIMSAIYSGDAELTEPTEFPGEHFPWIRVYGDYLCVDGKVFWTGLTPYIMDAQKAFNLGMTSAYESVARAPLSQMWATAKQAEGLSQHWATADKVNAPFQIYNADPQSPGPPQRIGGAEIPVANIQMSQIGAEEIKANSGIFDASLGNKSNETSGVALRAREAQGEIATFNYQDNMAKAVRRTWEITIGLIPYIYDTVRSLRVLGQDGSEKFVKVNEPDANGDILNDLGRGKYDVTITVGPSYSTRRQEATEVFSEMGRANPQIWGVAGDIMVRNMDVPGSEQLAKRLEALLPPQIQKQLQEGKDMPPEVLQAMSQVEQAGQIVDEKGKMVEAAAAEATQLKTEAEQATAKAQVEKSNVQIAMANLKTEEANFKAMQAQFEAQVAELNGKIQAEMMQIQQGQEKADGTNVENSAALDKINQAADAIAQMADAFLQQAAQVVMEAKQEAPIVIERARATGTRSKRVNGDLVTTVLYDDGTEKQIKASRMNGELLTSVQ